MVKCRRRRSKWIKDSLKWLFLTSSIYYFFYAIDHQPSSDNVYQQDYGKSESKTVHIDRELLDDLAFHLRDTPYDGVENYIRLMTAIRGLKSLPGVKPLVPDMGPVVNDISWFQYPINLPPCAGLNNAVSNRMSSRSHRRNLFIGVISAAQYFERRNAIRQTWHGHLMTQSNIQNRLDVVGFGFVIGLINDTVVKEKVKEESEEYGDILQINMVDTYANLSMKGAGLLNWVNTYCSRVDFVLKVDDDVYVNVHNLATVLHSLKPWEPSVYGHRVGENMPDRIGGKWRTGFEIWPWERLPIYFQGAGVIIAGCTVHSLLAAIQTTPYFIWEDLYLIGLCAVKAKINLRTSNQIFVDEPEDDSDPCFVRNSVMWTTKSVDRMRSSHFVSQCFYQTPPKVRCISNKTIYDQPTNATDFPFGFAEQN